MAAFADPAQASEAAAALRKAMKGWGTDEDTLTDMICGSSIAQIRQIREAFTNDLGRDLIADVKSEVGGDYEDVLVALLMDPAEYDAKLIHKACKGMGTDETVISEILTTRTHAEIQAIRAAYKDKYDKDVLSVLEDETSGDLEKVWNLLVTRGELMEEKEDVDEDVEELYKAGQGTWGTNEGVFIRKLCGNSRAYCDKLYHAYADKYGKALDDVIEDEMSGDLGKCLSYLVTPPEIIFSKRIRKSVKGMGTNDTDLIRVICTQKERYLADTCERYLRDYKKTVAKAVESECSGDYRKALLKTLDVAVHGYPEAE